jgi:hypothetical protein
VPYHWIQLRAMRCAAPRSAAAAATQWTVKIECLHLQFDNVVRDLNYSGFPTAFRHTVSDLSTDTVRIGMNSPE